MTNPVELIDSIGVDSFKTDTERYAAKEAARRLLARIETPFERIWALAFENPVLTAGLQMCQDLGIWDKWVAAVSEGDEGRTQTLESLLGFCNTTVEPNLLCMFCWQVGRSGFTDTWQLPRPLSQPYGCPKCPGRSWIQDLGAHGFLTSYGRWGILHRPERPLRP